MQESNWQVEAAERLGLDPQDENGSRPAAGIAGEPKAEPAGKAYVIGAGVTGLTAAWQLAKSGWQVQLLEATRHVGGMASTFHHGEFILDQGPHKFFSVMEDRMALAKEIMGEEGFLEVPKRSRIRLLGKFLNYPISITDAARNLNPGVAISWGFSYFAQLFLNLVNRRPAVSYEDWLVQRFGRRLYEMIFAAYARKIWGDPKLLARELAETRVAIPGLLALLWRMLVAKRRGPVIHAETFFYPRLGSGEFSRRLAELFLEEGGELIYGQPVTRLELVDGRVAALHAAGQRLPVGERDVVVATTAAGYLAECLDPAPPEDVLAAAKALHTRHLVLVYVILDKPSVSDDSWLFFPEGRYPFTRVFEQKNFSAAMVPEQHTCLCAEVVCVDEETWRRSDEDIYASVVDGLAEAGLLQPDEVTEHFCRRLKWVYPVYDLDYQENCATLLSALDGIENLYSVGRQGGFNYIGQIDCLDIGMVTAEEIANGRGKSEWDRARERFRSYVVLD